MTIKTKTPYELRADLLSLAQGICNDRNWTERQRLENDWNMKREKWENERGSGYPVDPPPFPAMPSVTTEEVIVEAKKLNEFVTNG